MALAPQFRRKLREGARPAFAAFAAVFLAAAIFSFTRPKIYEARAGLEILHYRSYPAIARGDLDGGRFVGSEDFSRYKGITKAPALLDRIADRLNGDEMRRLADLRPGESGKDKRELALKRLVKGHRIEILALSHFVVIKFRDKDPAFAAKVANLFLEEFIDFESQYQAPKMQDAATELLKNIQNQQDVLAERKARALAISAETSLDERDAITRDIAKANSRLKFLEAGLPRVQAGYSSVAIIDRAAPPAPENYVSPNHALNLGLGALAGLLAAALNIFLRRHPCSSA